VAANVVLGQGYELFYSNATWLGRQAYITQRWLANGAGSNGQTVFLFGGVPFLAPLVGNNYLLQPSPVYFENAMLPIAANTDITTIANYDKTTFKFWVGQTVFFNCNQTLVPVIVISYAYITSIAYLGGKAVIRLNAPIAGAVMSAGLCMFAQSLNGSITTINYPEKWELTLYKANPILVKDVPMSNKYKRWVYDGDTIPQITVNGIYEKTFLLSPLTQVIVLCICNAQKLISDPDTLVSYRLLIDGIDTCNRDIVLIGDNTMKFERLTSGFSYLNDFLQTLTVWPAANLLSSSPTVYTIIQDIQVDGEAHKLTVSLKNGSGVAFPESNIRLFKLVLSQF